MIKKLKKDHFMTHSNRQIANHLHLLAKIIKQVLMKEKKMKKIKIIYQKMIL
jgi:hypothetical protein